MLIIKRDKKSPYRNNGKFPEDHCFLDGDDVRDWAGLTTWKNGKITIVHPKNHFAHNLSLIHI